MISDSYVLDIVCPLSIPDRISTICFIANCYFAFSSDELERHEDYFLNLIIELLSAYEVCDWFCMIATTSGQSTDQVCD